MKWTRTQIRAATLVAALAPTAARATAATYRYAITSHQFGSIGVYERSDDGADGLEHAKSKLRIAVRVLGVPVYREQADESETWRGGQLIAFESRSMVGSKPMLVHGELIGGRLQITTPRGIRFAPPGTVAADPWSCRKPGPATVVTVRTGEILKINVTGGESERVLVAGVLTPTRHYTVSTAGRPDWWQVWLDAGGVPVKFRNVEHGRTIDFALVSAPTAQGGNTIALGR